MVLARAAVPKPGAKAARTRPHQPGKAAPTAAVTNAYAAMPDAERRALLADLSWVSDDGATAGGDFDQRAVDAIKAFQKNTGGQETGILSEQQRALLAAAAKRHQVAVGWQVFEDSETGVRLGLPEMLVARSKASALGGHWTSGHGQIQVETFRYAEAGLAALFEDEKKTPRERRVEWSVLKPDYFVISGLQRLKKFLVRAESRGGEVRGVTVLYDQATEGIMGRVAAAMSNAFEGFPDPNAGLPIGFRRKVDYGSAIIVDRNGHLIAQRQVTDACEAITIAGLGHAERIAVDAANDLALLRVYGAGNLAPAGLAGENSKDDNLTISGVADPLAQSGGGAVTSVAARLTPQGLQPAPQPGFAGAAVVDPKGHFAGVLDLKSAVVAGSGSTSQQAMLIPTDVVRSFLAAQGITPAAGHGAIDQSIVRVICIRK